MKTANPKLSIKARKKLRAFLMVLKYDKLMAIIAFWLDKSFHFVNFFFCEVQQGAKSKTTFAKMSVKSMMICSANH
jgi:hypothetical protein